jgi:hypothetical protein
MVAVSPALLLSALEVISFQRGGGGNTDDEDSFGSTIWCVDDETGKAAAATSSSSSLCSQSRQQQPQRRPSKQQQHRHRRRVRFDDAANTVHADIIRRRSSLDNDDNDGDVRMMDVVDDDSSQREEEDDDDMDANTTTWYSTAEYLHLRQSAILAAQQIIAIESRNRAPRSYIKVMERCYDRCLHLQLDEYERHDRVHVVRWIQAASSRIGLEKGSIKRMSIERSRRRLGVVQAVLNSQNDDHANDYDEDEARRVASLRWSQPAVVFARVWADAIAVAVRNENAASSSWPASSS